jgi:DNA-binding GntR family transcriptional regulator
MTAPVPLPRAAAPPRPQTPARERFERIYGVLRDRICLLEYPPGCCLVEEIIAEEFSISRTPVRRVLTRLETEGLVEVRQGVGTIVTDVRLEALIDVFQLRMELAVLIGRLSPVPPDAAVLAHMHALLQRCDELEQRPEHKAYARLNRDFFFALSAMVGNAPLREISERLYFQTARIWLLTVPVSALPEEVAVFRREMTDILGAAEIGDLEAVGHLRRSHISMSVARMIHYSRSPSARR